MHKLLEVPRRNIARARLTISLARLSPTKGVILVILQVIFNQKVSVDETTQQTGENGMAMNNATYSDNKRT